MSKTTKIFTVAHVPVGLEQKWLQHLRNFDTKNPGCRFEVMAEPPPDKSMAEMIEMLRVDPNLNFTKILTRK